MIEMEAETTINTTAAAERVRRAAGRALSAMAFRIRKSAMDSVDTDKRYSKAGEPPNTREGQLRRAIAYDVDRKELNAVVGPVASIMDDAGAIHEFGGSFRGGSYDARPFMGPALDANTDDFAQLFKDSI